MGAKTLKRLAILVTTVLISSLSTYFLWGYQVEKMGRSHLAEAKRAEKNENFDEAARLYEEHLFVAPDDFEAMVKCADVYLKGPKNPAHRERAAQLYTQYATRYPAEQENVRRHLAELLVEFSRYGKALPLLENLLKSQLTKGAKPGPDDGELRFLLGRCQEETDELSKAEQSYREAIDHRAPQRVEAYSRLAALLLKKLKKLNEDDKKKVKNEADGVIEEMVKSDPENYQVYLERGRYRRLSARTSKELEDAKQDLQKALKKNSKDPKVYSELAALARSSRNDAEARRYIEDGHKVLPEDPMLHLERASLELPGSIDKAITSLRHSVDQLPDQPVLRYYLAELLAQRGETTDLLKEISELKRLNLSQNLIGLLEARYLVNRKQWKEAISSLVRLQSQPQLPQAEAQVHDLLAECYRRLGDAVRESEELERSIRANPQDVQARLKVAASMVERREIDNAIKEYRQLLDQFKDEHRDAELAAPRVQLFRLLMSRKDLTEAEKLIKEFDPQSRERFLLQTELLVSQGKMAEAQKLMDEARTRIPRDVDLWVTSANLARQQAKFDDARNLLDQAEKSLGDSVALRLERSLLLMAQGGEGLPKTLAALAENSASFSTADRRRLIRVLAEEAERLQDRTLATGLWSQAAQLDPTDLEPHLRLFNLALQGNNKAEIENRVNEIKQIEGSDGLSGMLAEAQSKIWQAANTTDRSEQIKLRSTAELLLSELMNKRNDWPQIPRLLANLTLNDLSQPDLKDDQKKSIFEKAANLYLQALKLAPRDLDIRGQATDLLYAAGRKVEAIKLWTELPTRNTDLLRQAAVVALRKGDKDGAMTLALKAKADNPNDFQASVLLAEMLLAKPDPDGAEKEVRAAVNANRADAARWPALVRFFTLTKKLEKAESAVHEAETAIKDKPLALAECCEVFGQAYKTAGQADKSKLWVDHAFRWYRLDREALPKNVKDPENLRRRFDYLTQYVIVMFRLYQINQGPELLNEAEKMIAELKSLGPDTFIVLEFEAQLFRARNQMGKVAELIRRAAQRPNLPDLERRALAQVAERLEAFSEAEALYRQCLEKGPNDAVVLNNLAWLMALRGGDKKEALEYIKRAIKLSGAKSELLDTRGVIYTKLDQSQDAITDLIEATKLDPSGPKYFHLAQAYLQAGKKPDAKKTFEEACAKGLTQKSLHALEVTDYKQLLKDLGTH